TKRNGPTRNVQSSPEHVPSTTRRSGIRCQHGFRKDQVGGVAPHASLFWLILLPGRGCEACVSVFTDDAADPGGDAWPASGTRTWRCCGRWPAGGATRGGRWAARRGGIVLP